MGIEETRLLIVLGTAHPLQMAENCPSHERNIDDPLYAQLIKHFLKESVIPVDFVFEEASGCGPTAAEKIADSLRVKYMDIDPHPDKRHSDGLSRGTGQTLNPPFDLVTRMFVDEQTKREEFWAQRIAKGQFQAGLVICGLVHSLSLSQRLTMQGFEVHAHYYVPYDKLCRRSHSV